MFESLRAMLGGETPPEPLPDPDARVATAALLVEAARADGVYEVSERNMIDRVLARRYGIGPAEAAGIRQDGEQLQSEAVDIVRFTRAIKNAIPYEERYSVVEALWEVCYADGVRDAQENALMRKLAGLLYVPDRDVGIARRTVAERLGIAED